MERSALNTRLHKVISEQLGVREEEVNQEVTMEGLGADSLDAVEILMALEEEFDIEISDAEFVEIGEQEATIAQIGDLVEKHLKD